MKCSFFARLCPSLLQLSDNAEIGDGPIVRKTPKANATFPQSREFDRVNSPIRLQETDGGNQIEKTCYSSVCADEFGKANSRQFEFGESLMDTTHAERRSVFLVLVAFLMNAFLVVGTANAGLSLLDDLFLKSDLDSDLFEARGGLGALTLVMTLLALAVIILVPHLPKIVLLPPLLVAIWQVFGSPGMAWSASDRESWIALDAIALASFAWSYGTNRILTGHWFLAASRFPFRSNLTVRTLLATPLAALAIAIVAVGALLAAVPVFIEQQSGGYLHFASNGLEVRETVLRKGKASVHLVGMVHIGEPSFYRGLFASIPHEALILAEGVTDREGRMKAKPTYENAARGLGLESQGEFQQLLAGSKQLPISQSPPQQIITPSAAKLGPFVVFADIDVSELSPTTLNFLEQVGTIFQSPSLDEAMRRYFEVATKFTEDEIKLVMEEIVQKRNQKVLSEFDKYASQYMQIYLPWGALHMPDLQAKMIERGFRVESQRMLPIARYQTIIDGLKQRLTDQSKAERPTSTATSVK
jgi:hypothetical protein